MSTVSTADEMLFKLGEIGISSTIVTTWGVMLLFILMTCFWHLKVIRNGYFKTAIEGIVITMEAAVGEVLPISLVRRVLPFVATLWLFVLISNLIGLIPGLHSPTSDLSATAALALLVFFSTHWFGMKEHGLKQHLRHYIEPSFILLPFHIISELTRTLALAIRLFGNMMSLEMASLLVVAIAGFLVPVPLLMLHVIEAVVQAYIFGMLALIYIAGALESQSLSTTKESSV